MPKHKGISLFLIPMKQPGITVTPLWTIGGWHVNQVFFDGVEIPGNAIVGRKDEGWNNVRITLNLERSAIGKVGLLMRLFDKIRTYAAERMMLSLVELEPQAVVEQHSHPHEQVGMVLEGQLTF